MTKIVRYNVVDTCGKTKGLKNNPWPLSFKDAKSLKESVWQGSKPKIVKASEDDLRKLGIIR